MDLLNHLSLEEKVGQLFISTYEDTRMNGELINLIDTYHISGIHLTLQGKQDVRILAKLTAEMQLYAPKELPLSIAVKQGENKENTIKQQVTEGFQQNELIKINNRLYTRQISEIVASELAALGITLNLAPALTLGEAAGNQTEQMTRLNAQHAL